MTPDALITTSVMLGLFVLAGGAYGGLYGAGRLWMKPRLVAAGFVCFGVQTLLVLGLLLVTPLAPVWKIFIVLSGLAYAMIPPVTWRYLVKLHRSEENAP